MAQLICVSFSFRNRSLIVVNNALGNVFYILSQWLANMSKGAFTNTHDDVNKWKHFPRYWPFVWGIRRSPVNFPHKGPVTRSFDVFFDLGLNKRLNKQSLGWWFETPSSPLWRHFNDNNFDTKIDQQLHAWWSDEIKYPFPNGNGCTIDVSGIDK